MLTHTHTHRHREAGDGAANRQLVSAAGWKIHSFITGPAVLNVGALEATWSSITSPAGAQIAAFSDGEGLERRRTRRSRSRP